jgi:hypothetical protein
MITAESSSATNPINALALLLIESRATRQRLGGEHSRTVQSGRYMHRGRPHSDPHPMWTGPQGEVVTLYRTHPNQSARKKSFEDEAIDDAANRAR